MAATKHSAAVDHQTTAADMADGTKAGIEAANVVDTSGAPQQIVPDVDMAHPAVDDDPRARTTIDMNRIDFNDPTISGAQAVEQSLKAQG